MELTGKWFNGAHYNWKSQKAIKGCRRSAVAVGGLLAELNQRPLHGDSIYDEHRQRQEQQHTCQPTEISATHRRKSKSWHPLIGNPTATQGTLIPCPQKTAQTVPSYRSFATSRQHPELHTDLEKKTQNALKRKGNARGLAADVAFQLSAGTRRNELTEKDALAGLDADLKGGGWTFSSHSTQTAGTETCARSTKKAIPPPSSPSSFPWVRVQDHWLKRIYKRTLLARQSPPDTKGAHLDSAGELQKRLQKVIVQEGVGGLE